MKFKLLGQGSALTMLAVAALWGNQASAQGAEGEVSEVVVTGSFIAGTPEDAALPVDVIGADELQRQGNPSTVEMMKRLTVSGGVIGDQNQYATTFLPIQGIATVNLRNLGPQRTLVLLNGRRLVNFPTRNSAVDLNTLPNAAIGRIEVLKDGAAATYGSDAIGGVVNFITRKNFNGLEVSGDVRYIADAYDPDYSLSANWGWSGDNGDVLLSAAWQRKGRLRPVDRDFGVPTYLENPDAGYSFTNNPTSFRPVVGANLPANLAAQIRDPGCATVGALAGFVGGNQVCLARYAGTTVNLQDPSDRFQLYGETNFELSDDVKFHGEALYSQTYTEGWTSPFPSGLQGPTALTSPFPGQYYAPATNPGLALLIQQFPNAFPAGTTGVVWNTSLNFRMFGLGGYPLTGNEANPVITDIKTYRVSGGFNGKLFDGAIGWDVSSTYHVVNFRQTADEYYVNRAELALRGYGSLAANPTCTAAVTNNFTTGAGNNALGCYYFNPFSNSFAVNSSMFGQAPGQANPLFNRRWRTTSSS